jgi:hypothetical protein
MLAMRAQAYGKALEMVDLDVGFDGDTMVDVCPGPPHNLAEMMRANTPPSCRAEIGQKAITLTLLADSFPRVTAPRPHRTRRKI